MLKLPIQLPVLLIAVFFLAGAGTEQSTHLDKGKLPFGCGTCHQGFGFQSGGGADKCVACHRRGRPVAGFIAGGVTPQDVETVLNKQYVHPWKDEEGTHRSGETLPEIDKNAKRHATCADCHNTHFSGPSRKYAGLIRGKVINQNTQITKEYEVCYLCHGESLNLPGTAKNKKAEFSQTNASYHPVEGEMRTRAGEKSGPRVPSASMLPPYKAREGEAARVATITCTSCHGSDSAKDAAGVHGSNYRYILRFRYETADKSFEGNGAAYALCYQCHDRQIVVSDQADSFVKHKLHVTGQGSTHGYTGTSCFSCHNSHGSIEYPYLLRFDPQLVSPNWDSTSITYKEDSPGSHKGTCILTCHGVEHRNDQVFVPATQASSTKPLSSRPAGIRVVQGVY